MVQHETKWRTALSVALLFVAISAQAETFFNYSVPADFERWASCATAGAGELIHLTGYFQLRGTITYENGWAIVQYHYMPKLTATGEITGIQYQVLGSESGNAKVNASIGETGTTESNFDIVGGGISYHLHNNFKYSYDTSGNITFKFDNFFLFCE